MFNSINLTLYTQDDCYYCFEMKRKLSKWGFNYREINVSHDLFAKDFLRENGHRTVPQLYWNNTHLNKLPTTELTYEHVCAELDYDNYIGGVENWSVRRV
tara:strand:+ start:9194 stop:9493 length:300 start_codon:yes stop_codon:yes gene_type:complete